MSDFFWFFVAVLFFLSWELIIYIKNMRVESYERNDYGRYVRRQYLDR